MATYPPPSPDVRRYCERRGFSSNVCEGGFSYLLHSWTKIVGQVESGYRGVLDEYLNDMGARKIIDELGPHASDDEWGEVEALLPSLDERFHKATRPVEACICKQDAAKRAYSADRDWWYFRVPLNLQCVADPGRWP